MSPVVWYVLCFPQKSTDNLCSFVLQTSTATSKLDLPVQNGLQQCSKVKMNGDIMIMSNMMLPEACCNHSIHLYVALACWTWPQNGVLHLISCIQAQHDALVLAGRCYFSGCA